ncbi:MAG: hypothetical protein CHACPFDD_01038 [Phycisphaerae bacterium]|nr:hypothetical protein [Phycisphaerae bacterium]
MSTAVHPGHSSAPLASPLARLPVTVWLVEPGDAADIEQFLERLPAGEPAGGHDARFTRFSLSLSGAYWLAAMRGDEIVGVLPLVGRPEDAESLVGCRPERLEGRIITVDDDARAALHDRAITLARLRGLRMAGAHAVIRDSAESREPGAE